VDTSPLSLLKKFEDYDPLVDWRVDASQTGLQREVICVWLVCIAKEREAPLRMQSPKERPVAEEQDHIARTRVEAECTETRPRERLVQLFSEVTHE
jgi:hypothetical protein